uniref:Uncharacterized protein n=1 Tax=Arundo donax TaxID=35708 RepID=A0A0A9FC68_ARUDO
MNPLKLRSPFFFHFLFYLFSFFFYSSFWILWVSSLAYHNLLGTKRLCCC